jgi:DNA-binding CsgD family transcriptional regulator
VDREDAAKNDGLRRLFNAREVQVIGRTTSFLAALRRLDVESIDVIVLGPEFEEEESSLFALSAKERGFTGLALRVIRIPRNPAGPSYPVPLTSRQRIVFERVSSGWTSKRIAQSLRCSEGAVKGTIQQLFRKLGVRKRVLLARIALENYRGKP